MCAVAFGAASPLVGHPVDSVKTRMQSDARYAATSALQTARGVLRGLHYQLENPQGKLVRVTQGAVFDVAVDIRRSSPHFGHWVGVELSAENHRMLWIPPGFAHGFVVLSETADFLYKCTTLYHPPSDRSLRWNDPTIAIAWPDVGVAPQLSGKDEAAPLLADADIFA